MPRTWGNTTRSAGNGLSRVFQNRFGLSLKAEDLMSELEACRSESRNYSSEVFRLKAACDESMEQLDVVKRENKVKLSTGAK